MESRALENNGMGRHSQEAELSPDQGPRGNFRPVIVMYPLIFPLLKGRVCSVNLPLSDHCTSGV